jgi:hypothetical protein
MSNIINRLEYLLEIEKEDLPFLRSKAENIKSDQNGSSSEIVGNSLRFVGVSEYVLNTDINSFKSNLVEAARIRLQLFLRFNQGEPISKSFLSMLSYKDLFNALATGEFDLAKKLALIIGGREEIEKEFDHPFDYNLGYALKSFVLNDRSQMEKWSSEFSKICDKKENSDFKGYALIFEAILIENVEKANEALIAIEKGHKKQSKGRGVFKNSEDEVLCVWGIGIANLCRSYGLNVSAIPPLIPDDLLVKSESQNPV